MLTTLSIGLRFRLAIALAAFAVLCFVAPPAVLASGHGEHTIECLAYADMVDHGMKKAHGMTHHGVHSVPSNTHQPGSGCCGLFCMSALPADSNQSLEGTTAGSALALPHVPVVRMMARGYSALPQDQFWYSIAPVCRSTFNRCTSELSSVTISAVIVPSSDLTSPSFRPCRI
jgi:hypothetical protein